MMIETGHRRVGGPLLPATPKGSQQPIAVIAQDSVSFSASVTPIRFGQRGNVTQLVTFGALKNPNASGPLGIQMRVRGVTAHQSTSTGSPATPPNTGKGRNNGRPKGDSINRLAASHWQDGQKVDFAFKQRGRNTIIELTVPGFGPVGYMHPEIARHISPLLRKDPKAFQFELSNIIAGMTKGAETIGLRVNLVYSGTDAKVRTEAEKAFSTALNDPNCRNKIMHYQPQTSPAEVLQRILGHEETAHGSAARKRMESAIANIARQIADPANQRILLIGHAKPDGDTIGCALGLEHALKIAFPNKVVDTAIDDKIPGLFRGKLPAIDTIRRPHNPTRIAELEQEIKTLKGQNGNASHIQLLSDELKELKDPTKQLAPKQPYDLAILMDIPTPKRFTEQFKPLLDKARSIIYIDHHPFRQNEWDAAAPQTGLDMQKALANNNVWIAEKVPACAQMVATLAHQFPVLKDLDPAKPLPSSLQSGTGKTKLDTYVANIITGMTTDTGGFTRAASLSPQDAQKPVEQQPNFMPEGLAKWMMALTPKTINKKWLRENIVYDLPDQTLKGSFQVAARELMLTHAVAGRKIIPNLSLGIVQVDYDQMKAVWEAAREPEPETTLLDIQNAFKYSEVLGTLRSDPKLNPGGRSTKGTTLEDRAKEDYKGSYDTERIAVLICQDQKAGELDEKLQIATENGLRLSIRSADGTNHAAILGGLFGGGGHGAAAGGRIDLPGVTLDTKLSATLNGQKTTDMKAVLAALEKNYATMNDHSIPQQQKKLIAVGVVADANGKNCAGILEDIVAEIRAKTHAKNTGRKGVVVPFAGTVIKPVFAAIG